MRNFTRKGYGRIYVDKIENIDIVRDEIKKISESEFDYLPNYLITTFSQYPKLCYTGKFDEIDLDYLTVSLWKKGVMICCIDNGGVDYLDYKIEESSKLTITDGIGTGVINTFPYDTFSNDPNIKNAIHRGNTVVNF